MKTFYLWGTILMFISALGQMWSLKINWVGFNSGNILTNFGQIAFSLLLTIFFGGLYIMTKKQLKVIESPEMDKLLKELNLKGGEKNGENNSAKRS